MGIKKIILSMALAAGLLASTTTGAGAVSYSFSSPACTDYYASTRYEDVCGVEYRYGGPNLAGIRLPGPGYGLSGTVGGGGYGDAPWMETAPVYSFAFEPAAFTGLQGMEYEDGSIGTVVIPCLGIAMPVWEGETNESMKKGMAHYSSTSAWDGNVALCGHNRGARYAIGTIKDLTSGDIILYTTIYGVRAYAVVSMEVISNDDWSRLQATPDNRLTITTCLADHPESRVCVQAREIAA